MASVQAISDLRVAAESGTGTDSISPTLRALVPNHPACAEALCVAEHWLAPAVFNHSFRVFLYAHAFLTSDDGGAPSSGSSPDTPLAVSPFLNVGLSSNDLPAQISALFVAALLHDIGTATVFDAVAARFEVLAADTAAAILRDHGLSPTIAREAWLAVALHTSPGIAEALGGMISAVRLAVRADFGSCAKPDVARSWQCISPGSASAVDGQRDNGREVEEVEWVEGELPRLGVEKVLGDRVVDGALGRWEAVKAPKGSWPGDLMRAKRAEPEWEGVNQAF